MLPIKNFSIFFLIVVSRYVFVSQGVYRDTYRIASLRIMAALLGILYIMFQIVLKATKDNMEVEDMELDKSPAPTPVRDKNCMTD